MANLRYQLIINCFLVRPQFYQTVKAGKFLVQILFSFLRGTRGMFGIHEKDMAFMACFLRTGNSFLHSLFLTFLHWLSSVAYQDVLFIIFLKRLIRLKHDIRHEFSSTSITLANIPFSKMFSPNFLVCCTLVFSMGCHGSVNAGKTRYLNLDWHANEHSVSLLCLCHFLLCYDYVFHGRHNHILEMNFYNLYDSAF